MRKQISSTRWIVIGAALAGGCTSIQNQQALDAVQNAMGLKAAVVEAYIEYPGPQAKWAGPGSLVVHVVARDGGMGRIEIKPALFDDADQVIGAARAPASALAQAGGMAPKAAGAETSHPNTAAQPGRKIDPEFARSQMDALAEALQSQTEEMGGCLSPVRVRMVRSDGSILEKQGCRGQVGWPAMASKTVSRLIDAMVGSTPG